MSNSKGPGRPEWLCARRNPLIAPGLPAGLTTVAAVATLLMGMKSVGINVLKNQLRRYLEMVRHGEVVLVTDRDEVVAEIRLPSELTVNRAAPAHANRA